MKVVIALDSFKGSVSSVAAGLAVAQGFQEAVPEAQLEVLAVADGGEGTLEAWAQAPGSVIRTEAAANCFGHPSTARYLTTPGQPAVTGERATKSTVPSTSRAVLECAQTVGIVSAHPVDETTSLRASSTSFGAQLKRILDLGYTDVVLGLGGSACTDGGVGFLLALGAQIYDQRGQQISAVPGQNPLLQGPTRVILPNLDRHYARLTLTAMMDVANPLTGLTGAARIFGPQKGATPAQIETLETNMVGWARALKVAGHNVAQTPGAGAAGGLGAALLALGAAVTPGFEYLAEELHLAQKFVHADLVITGEGRIDASTGGGKAPAAIAKLAKETSGAYVVALAGKVDLKGQQIPHIDKVLGIHRSNTDPSRVLDEQVTRTALSSTAQELAAQLEKS